MMDASASEPTVYITSFQDQDISHAKTFGRVKAISVGRIETFKLDQLAAQVTAALKDSRPEDWLITTGHMVLGIFAAVEFIRRHNRLNLLIWHAKLHKYIPRVVRVVLGADITEPMLQEMLQSELPIDLA
jgi:hypothetical protein